MRTLKRIWGVNCIPLILAVLFSIGVSVEGKITGASISDTMELTLVFLAVGSLMFAIMTGIKFHNNK